MPKPTLGIIGFGAFGRIAAKYLRPHFEIVVADNRLKAKGNASSYKVVSLGEAAGAEVVLLCVPISEMEPVLKKIRRHIRASALVVDVCSVKSIPCRQMKRILPSSTKIIGTHPLFGPQSVKDGDLLGKNVVVCPVRSSRKEVAEFSGFLKSLGLNVFVMTPKQHDIEAAKAQALLHFAMRGLEDTGLRKARLPLTKSREKLIEAMDFVAGDSEQLFRDMNRQNPFASSERKKFIKLLQKIDRELK